MTPLVKIQKESNCSIAVIDITQDSDQYLMENIEDTTAYHQRNKFKYSETVTINILMKHTYEESKVVQFVVTDHCSYLDEEHFSFKDDGYYTIEHAIIPKIDYADIQSPLIQYLWDGTSIQKLERNHKTEVTTEEFVRLISDNKLDGTTISGVSLTQFSLCHLYECFIKKCQESFKNLSPCSPNNNTNRDLVWMAINIIKYYVELGQLLQAQRLLEQLNYCGELCSEGSMFQKHDCRCSKRT